MFCLIYTIISVEQYLYQIGYREHDIPVLYIYAAEGGRHSVARERKTARVHKIYPSALGGKTAVGMSEERDPAPLLFCGIAYLHRRAVDMISVPVGAEYLYPVTGGYDQCPGGIALIVAVSADEADISLREVAPYGIDIAFAVAEVDKEVTEADIARNDFSEAVGRAV